MTPLRNRAVNCTAPSVSLFDVSGGTTLKQIRLRNTAFFSVYQAVCKIIGVADLSEGLHGTLKLLYSLWSWFLCVCVLFIWTRLMKASVLFLPAFCKRTSVQPWITPLRTCRLLYITPVYMYKILFARPVYVTVDIMQCCVTTLYVLCSPFPSSLFRLALSFLFCHPLSHQGTNRTLRRGAADTQMCTYNPPTLCSPRPLIPTPSPGLPPIHAIKEPH